MDDCEKQAREYVEAFLAATFEKYKDLDQKPLLQHVLADVNSELEQKTQNQQTLQSDVEKLNEFAELEEG